MMVMGVRQSGHLLDPLQGLSKGGQLIASDHGGAGLVEGPLTPIMGLRLKVHAEFSWK
jgi:hypothetical protein